MTEWDKIPSIKVGDFTLEVEFGPPCKELQEIAKNELRETPELQQDAIARLRELLKGERNIYAKYRLMKIIDRWISNIFLSTSRDKFEMPRGERRMARPISQAVQILPGIGVESGEELLQFQGEALERVREFEAEQGEEHIRAKHLVGVA